MTLERLTEELRRVAITTSYLFVCFSAVLFYRMAALHSYGIDFAPFGLAAVKALVMGKFVMLGRMTGIGDRYKDKPLIYPVLHQSLLFLVLLIALSLAEETIKGWFHGNRLLTYSATWEAGCRSLRRRFCCGSCWCRISALFGLPKR
jgi:hypothetical protein